LALHQRALQWSGLACAGGNSAAAHWGLDHPGPAVDASLTDWMEAADGALHDPCVPPSAKEVISGLSRHHLIVQLIGLGMLQGKDTWLGADSEE
jgi:hypothetical protein